MKTIIAGPCVHEHSVQWLVDQAHAIKEQIPPNWRWVFKCSFDKANRTRHDSFRGIGLDKTLEAFERIRKQIPGIKITTDIHEPWQAAYVAPIVDVIQIPAALSRQTDLIKSAACVAPIVNLKCGVSTSPDKMGQAAKKVRLVGSTPWLTYRGTAFGDELVMDPMRVWNLTGYGPVIVDITHLRQKPGGVDTDGERDGHLVYGRVAMSFDLVDGLFAECHPEPSKALSDASVQIPIRRLRQTLEYATNDIR